VAGMISEAILWEPCRACGADFEEPVGHCPGCDRHWSFPDPQERDDLCPWCHEWLVVNQPDGAAEDPGGWSEPIAVRGAALRWLEGEPVRFEIHPLDASTGRPLRCWRCGAWFTDFLAHRCEANAAALTAGDKARLRRRFRRRASAARELLDRVRAAGWSPKAERFGGGVAIWAHHADWGDRGSPEQAQLHRSYWRLMPESAWWRKQELRASERVDAER